jgi:hypothetical protein
MTYATFINESKFSFTGWSFDFGCIEEVIKENLATCLRDAFADTEGTDGALVTFPGVYKDEDGYGNHPKPADTIYVCIGQISSPYGGETGPIFEFSLGDLLDKEIGRWKHDLEWNNPSFFPDLRSVLQSAIDKIDAINTDKA